MDVKRFYYWIILIITRSRVFFLKPFCEQFIGHDCVQSLLKCKQKLLSNDNQFHIELNSNTSKILLMSSEIEKIFLEQYNY